MNARIRKALYARFQQEFERRVPQFRRLDDAGDNPTWAWALAADLTFFVMLTVSEGSDQFRVEVAWSDEGEFPWGDIGDLSDIAAARLRSRLSWLWATGSREQVWDFRPEESEQAEKRDAARKRGRPAVYPPDRPVEQVLPQVVPFVDDAVDKVVQYGLPLFRRVAECRGVKWPPQGGSSTAALP